MEPGIDATISLVEGRMCRETASKEESTMKSGAYPINEGKAPLKDSIQTEDQTELLGMKHMAVPIFAGILSTLRRVIARRVSLKGSSDSGIKLPFSSWTYWATILFGVILIFYIDNIAEER
ncbi:hypothetical protein Sjap_015072 [Stephania japonica]|uniref:Uncharacterized protein n=1 Tax=Stephania japonica TaxID=461633 RepID=A0AAP0NSI5_9MAGN